jgi:hypothetical protein
MQIHWRQHEQLVAISIFIILLVNEIIGLPNQTTGDPIQNHLAPFLLLYGSTVSLVLGANYWIKKQQVSLIPAFIALLSTWVLLSALFAGGFYLRHFYLQPGLGNTIFTTEAWKSGLQDAGILLIVYANYLYFRESMIHWLLKAPGQPQFRTMVTNKITAILFSYAAIGVFLYLTGPLRGDGPAIVYVFLLLPTILIVLINVYGIFPLVSRHTRGTVQWWKRLLIFPIIFTIVISIGYFVVIKRIEPLPPIILLLILLLVVTPLSWLLYQKQKAQIDTLHQMEKELGQQKADLAFLRSQINPHFLFNSLNTLYALALQESAVKTSTGIQQLGDMMRFMLHENNRDRIPLQRELDYIRNYLSLQLLRLNNINGIQINSSIGEQHNNLLIAPMLLIPFIENAFKHGISITHPSFITINCYCNQQQVFLDLVNSKHPSNATQLSETGASGIGLENVQQRLQLLYPQQHSLTIQQDNSTYQIHLTVQLTTSS